MTAVVIPRSDWQAALLGVAGEEGLVEVAAMNHTTGQTDGGWHRTRLAAIEQGAIVVQRPSSAATRAALVPGRHVCLMFAAGPNRWTLYSRVEGFTLRPINDHTRLACLVLQWPREVSTVQRRAFFRAATASLDLPDVHLQPLIDDASAQAADLPARARQPLRAQLVNISGGGLGLVVDHSAAPAANRFLDYRCTLQLPTHDAPLELTVRHVHLRRNANETLYLGVMFVFDDLVQQRHVADTICRFTTALQRRKLRRRRV